MDRDATSGKNAAETAAVVSKSRNETESTLAPNRATAFAPFSNSAGQDAHKVLAGWMEGREG